MATPAPYSNLPSVEQITGNRALGNRMMQQGLDASPVGHWTQALARVLQAGVGRANINNADTLSRQRNDALMTALGGSGVMKDLAPADQAILGSSPELMQSAYIKVLARKLDPAAGLPNSVREFQYAQSNPAFKDYIREQKRGAEEYGKQGAIFQGEDGRFYSMQFGNHGERIVKPIETGNQPLRPAKGVQQVGDELIDKATGVTVRNVTPQIENKEAAEARGTARGKIDADLPRIVDNAAQALDVIEQIRAHPGKKYGTGILGVLPPIPSTEQAGFIDLVEQAKGKTFLEAFNALRGGGQITEAEGRKATEALARLQRARRPADFDKALSDLEAVIQAGAVRSYRQAGRAPVSPAPSPGTAAPVPPTAANPLGPSGAVIGTGPPSQAIDFLHANPTPDMMRAFDEKYGPGAAKRALRLP